MLAVELDGEGDERAVFFEDFFDAVFLGEVLGVVLELKHDLGAAGGVLGGGFEGVAARALAAPDVGGCVDLPGFGEDLDGFGGHEGGIETDTELANEVGVFLAALAEGLEEGLGAGVGDGAEVFGELVASHADAGVLDGEGFGLLVGGDGDFEGAIGVVNVLFGQLEVP